MVNYTCTETVQCSAVEHYLSKNGKKTQPKPQPKKNIYIHASSRTFSNNFFVNTSAYFKQVHNVLTGRIFFIGNSFLSNLNTFFFLILSLNFESIFIRVLTATRITSGE